MNRDYYALLLVENWHHIFTAIFFNLDGIRRRGRVNICSGLWVGILTLTLTQTLTTKVTLTLILTLTLTPTRSSQPAM